jgi:hypothetical protein
MVNDAITCITSTGDRLETLMLTKKWLDAQTLKPDQWLVVDDGRTPIPVKNRVGMDYVRREPKVGERNTLPLNLLAAIPHVKGDHILFIEDDDWYSPEYVRTMVAHLQGHALVGQSRTRYYHLPTRKYLENRNDEHSSLATTAMSSELLGLLIQACRGRDAFVDLRLWKWYGRGLGYLFSQGGKGIHCGMKGLPGRPGIGTGHNPRNRRYRSDEDYAKLREWIGDEGAGVYKQLMIGSE